MEDFPTAGAEYRTERVFTREMVQAFTEISGDRGRHHIVANERGQVVVHGLLLASLATEIGGQLDFLARTMDFEFLRPVWTGDTVTCVARVESVEPRGKYVWLRFVITYRDSKGEEVLRAVSTGVIRATGGAS
jgi:3-hydroxybutyryl-CoA dehydratase